MLKLNYRCCISLAIFLLSGITNYGRQLSFNHLTVEQGLSQNSVLSITQDKRGFIWLGTRYGLNRFDGRQVMVYKNEPGDTNSISSNYINVLLTDARGDLWVGTSEGLDRLDAARNIFRRYSISGKTEKANINSLAEQGGKLWVATAKGLYFLKDPASNILVHAGELGNLQCFRSRNIMRLFRDSRDNLWIASDKLYKLSKTNDGYKEEAFCSRPDDPGSLSDSYVQSITEDKQGRIWIATINGLNSLQPATGKITRYFYNNSSTGLINNNVRAVLTDQAGKIWVGTQEGISLMDPQTLRSTHYINDASNEKSLSQNSVHSLFEDAGGSIWVGTFFGGANITHRITTPFTVWQHGDPGLSNNVVSSIVSGNNLIWIGTEGGGLNCYNTNSNQFTVYKNVPGNTSSLNSNLVKTLFIDKDKHLWVGTHGGGLDLFDPTRSSFSHYLYDENRKQSEIVALLEDSKGRFWVGAHSGLKVFRRNNTILNSIGYEPLLAELAPRNISALLEDRQQNIWIGALEGLYLFRPDNTLHQLSINKQQAPNINCIFQDRNGNIMLGLYNEGLALFREKDSSFLLYTTANGLPNNNVLGILEDERQQLWISTSNGLARFDPVNGSFQTYTTSDGLAGNEFNNNAFYKAPDGEMYFGGITGLTSFLPSRIERNTRASPLVFTGLRIFNTPVSVDSPQSVLSTDIGFTNKLELTAQQNTFTIEFALLNFIRPDKNRYAYKLEGVHREWTEIQSPSATFTNLPAGNYTLLIKGANNDGVWSEPRSMQITVLPPFWKTGLAYLLYLLLAAAILFFLIRFFYLRALLKRDKELHEIKLNFFTNISHEIRTHLTLIMAPLEKIQKENAQNSVLQHHLGNARTNVNRLLKLVTELMDFRKAESSHLKLHIARQDLIAFLNNIFSSFEDLSQSRNIRLSFTYDAPTELYFDREQMEKVFYNLLTNAFKFTPDGGSIALHAENRKDKVAVHVTDNGKGIPPEYLDKLFTNYFQVNDHNEQNTGYGIGLALSKTIVELHKGKLTVESEAAGDKQEGYTRFTISLLKGRDHFERDLIREQPPLIPAASLEKDKTIITDTSINSIIPENSEKKYHILITEDNTEVRNLIKDTLQGYEITESGDGETGWLAATEQIPDLVISDVMMPGMNGFELCARLKTDGRTSHIPVVLLTAKSSQNDHISGLNTGADVYLTKPFSTQVLELTVKNLLLAREKMRQKFSKEFVLGPQSEVINTSDEQFLSKLIQQIEEFMTDPEFGVELLAGKMAMSQSVLYKKLKAVTNMSVNDFAKTIRLKKAAQLLQTRQYSVFDVSLMVGFNDRKYFSKEFRKQFGKSPSDYIGTGEPG